MAEHIYELGLTKTTGAAAGPIVTIIPAALSSTVPMPDIREIGVFNVSGVAAEVGIGVPAAAGSGTVTGGTVQDLTQTLPAGSTQMASSFATTQPTAPTNFYRRFELQAVAGSGIIFTWSESEFRLWSGGTASGQLVVWQLSALAVTYDCYVKVCE